MQKLTLLSILLLSSCAYQTPIKPAAQNQYESDLQLCESMAGHIKSATINNAAGKSDSMSFGLGLVGGAVGGALGSVMDTHMAAKDDPNYHKTREELTNECMIDRGHPL